MSTTEDVVLDSPPVPRRRSYITWFLVILVLISSGFAFYFYQKSVNNTANAQQASQAEIKSLIAQVGRLILLPLGEDPTVATVVDPDKLKDQAFFANASKGDKVLIYVNAKRAILYNPAKDKIINVAPVDINNTTASAPQAPPPFLSLPPTTSTKSKAK